MRFYIMPDKCHDEGCIQLIGHRWTCDECKHWERFKEQKGPFKQKRMLGVKK